MVEQQLLPLLGDTQILRVQDFSSFFASEFPAGSRVALLFAEGERPAVRNAPCCLPITLRARR